ncbi:MAG TPA: CoA-binding protein [Sphingobacterium sp.]|nr:CoA-binding protein [Sphingobacterium sp.]
MKTKTLIIGASTNPNRYSYLVAHKLVRKGHEIVNVGIKKGRLCDVPIEDIDKKHKDIQTVTLYVSPKHQPYYYDYILETKPERLIFNPGTENAELRKMAEENGIETIEACTLVMLNTGQY